MRSMFNTCSKLTSIDVSELDTSSCEEFQFIFQSVTVTELDLSSFDTNNAVHMYGMFQDCSNLKTIYVSDKFVTTNVIGANIRAIFRACSNLVGGAGTKWTSSMEYDMTYARIDGGTSSPGLFTLK